MFDVAIADNDIGVPFEEAAEMKAFGYDDFTNLSAAFIKFNINDVADSLAVTNINNFFFLKK